MRKLIATIAITGVVLVAGGQAYASPTKSPRAKWQAYTTAALPLITDVGDKMTAVSTAAGNEDTTDVTSACLDLGMSVIAAKPVVTHSPSKRLNRLIRQGFDEFTDAATSCVGMDYTETTSHIVQGTVYVKEATAEVQSIKVRYDL